MSRVHTVTHAIALGIASLSIAIAVPMLRKPAELPPLALPAPIETCMPLPEEPLPEEAPFAPWTPTALEMRPDVLAYTCEPRTRLGEGVALISCRPQEP